MVMKFHSGDNHVRGSWKPPHTVNKIKVWK